MMLKKTHKSPNPAKSITVSKDYNHSHIKLYFYVNNAKVKSTHGYKTENARELLKPVVKTKEAGKFLRRPKGPTRHLNMFSGVESLGEKRRAHGGRGQRALNTALIIQMFT